MKILKLVKDYIDKNNKKRYSIYRKIIERNIHMQKEFGNGKMVIKISIMWFFLLVLIIALICSFFENYIFATNQTSSEIEKRELYFEENLNKIDTLKLMIQNNYTDTKLVNEERKIKYLSITKETKNLPKGEEVVKQKGKSGKQQVTALQKYQDKELIGEEIIESTIIKDPVTKVIYKGTSEFLSKYSVHVGDKMYLIEAGDLKEEPKEEAKTIKSIKRYLNITLKEMSVDGWVKVEYDSKEGYLQEDKLTSEAVTPKIAEKNRIAKLQQKLSKDMDLSKPSGLTLSDYITIFSFNVSDENNIFADNAENFYNAEQEYGINGIFLASIGIHESAWGTSRLARTKNNLFGYGAYDRDPEGCAIEFETYKDAINTVASALKKNYLTPSGSYYNGNTAADVNMKYASDDEWSNKVYKYMEYLYNKLG